MNYLFDNKYKKISGLVFYLTSIIGLYLLITDKIFDLFTLNVYSLFSESISDLTYGGGWIENGLGDEIFTTIIIISGLINSFSKEKIEDELISKIKNSLKNKFITEEDILITRERHRQHLVQCVDHLKNFLDKNDKKDFDKAAEDLRLATRHLGMIVGKVDVEEILGSIFNDFCIGK